MIKRYFLAVYFLSISMLTFGQTQIGQRLNEFATTDSFGASVAISDAGDRILTSAPRFDTGGVDLAGRVDAYQFDGSEWVPLGSTIEGTPTELGLFGQGLDMSGSGNRIAMGNNNAQAQVYQWNETTEDWEQMGDDLEFPGQPGAAFKTFRFAVDENLLVAGATGAGPDSVYLFQWDGTNWNAVGNPIEQPVRNELAISDDAQTVAVLFQENNVENGIEIYQFDGTDWNLQFDRTFPATRLVSDGFDLSGDGTRLVMSSVDDTGSSLDGTFETYDLVNGQWVKNIGDFILPFMENRNNALRLSADGTILIFGGGLESTTAEASGAYIYQLINDVWTQVQHFDYDNNDEGILGNVDITPDGSKVVFGRSLINEIGYVEVYEISDVLNVDEVTEDRIGLYPNPTTGNFHIRSLNQLPILDISISDSTGKRVQDIAITEGSNLDTYDFEIQGGAGMYFVSVQSAQGTTTIKLIKK